jgi:hypothetical protein
MVVNKINVPKTLSYLEQQIWSQILTWNTFKDSKQFHYSSLSIATQLIVYVKDQSKYKEFQARLEKWLEPNIKVETETENNVPGSRTLEDAELNIKIPILRGNTRFGYAVFREYQLQKINYQMVMLIQDILRELISQDGKFPFEGVIKSSAYLSLLGGNSGSEDENESNEMDEDRLFGKHKEDQGNDL